VGEIHQLAQRVLARQRLRSISAASAASLADSTLSHCPTSKPLGQAGHRGQRLASALPARQRQCLLAQVAITDDFEERAAIIEYEADVPRPWAEGFAHMLIMPRPEAVPEIRWREAIDDGGRFLDKYGHQAAALGWRPADIFARTDRLGLAFLIHGAQVTMIDEAGAVIATTSGSKRFYRATEPGQPVWLHDTSRNTVAGST
jgi:hypothetical protein